MQQANNRQNNMNKEELYNRIQYKSKQINTTKYLTITMQHKIIQQHKKELAGTSTTHDSHCIPPLHSHWKPQMEEIQGGVCLSRFQLHAPLNLPQKSPGLGANDSQSLYAVADPGGGSNGGNGTPLSDQKEKKWHVYFKPLS